MSGSTHRLGDYLESRREKGEEGLPTLSVTLNRGLVRRESLDRKMDTNLKDSQHIKVMPGDIAYNMMRMWQGASGLADEEAIVSPAYVVLAPKGNIDPRYAASLFKTPKMIHLFWAYSYGLTNDRLRLYPKDIQRVPVEIPPLPEQRKIAEILSVWDRAIEVSEALLATARRQKRALMQTLLTGKTRFPEFVGQEWKEVRLGEVGETISGGTPSSTVPKYWNGDVPWATPTDITKLSTRFIRSTARMITKEGLKTSSAKLVPVGAILICTRATIGEMAIATGPICTNQGFKNLVLTEDFNSDFIYYLLQFFKNKLVRQACGSTFLELSKKDFDKISFAIPALPEQRRIASVLNVVEGQIENHCQNIHHLRTEKRALMQQLLTGKRRVRV